MDSDSSDGESSTKRRKRNSDHLDNANESVEELPKILSPEIHDVFHVFASMLDIKSFVKLAMTSKDMYRRCMDDKQIKISVDGVSLSSHRFKFTSSDVPTTCIDSYIATLRKLPCKVSMSSVDVTCETNAEPLNDSRKYLKEIGAKRIEELMLDFDGEFTDSEAVISFIKDFDVVSLIIYDPPQNDALLLILGSILQMNLKRFCYEGPVPDDFICKIESSIPEISFPGATNNISKGELTNIMSKIQSGSLRRLSVDLDVVNWDNYDKLPFDHKGPLPEDRPLLFARNDFDIDEYWFLHWIGGVTKLVRDHHDFFTLEIFKCEPWELPCALRKNEDILNALAEKRPRVCCSSEQFHNFTAGFTMFDPSHKGPLPDGRPLYCKVSKNRFWMLEEDENLMKCCWEEGSATWKSFNPDEPMEIDHPALNKHMIWKVLKQMVKYTELYYFCKGPKEFDSWLEDFEILAFKYSGELPSTLPLVFKGKKKDSRIVFLEDQLLECKFNYNVVEIKRCHCLNSPPSLVTAKTLVEILKDPDHKTMNFNISFDVFRDGLLQLEKSIVVLQKRLLISEKTETEYWYRNGGVVWKVEWKDGRVSIAKADLHESPPLFLKQVFRCLVEERSKWSFTLDLEQFRNCLEQFTVVPFDYSGPLTSDPPLAFVKNEIRHTCSQRATCQCSEVSSILVWFLLEDGFRYTKFSCGRNGRKKVQFGTPTSDFMTEVPVMLQSTEYLKNLLEEKYGRSASL